MTPLGISILLHYYASPVDFRDGDFSAPAVRMEVHRLASEGLLAAGSATNSNAYSITDRGRVYVQALQNVPLPTQSWVVPGLYPLDTATA